MKLSPRQIFIRYFMVRFTVQDAKILLHSTSMHNRYIMHQALKMFLVHIIGRVAQRLSCHQGGHLLARPSSVVLTLRVVFNSYPLTGNAVRTAIASLSSACVWNPFFKHLLTRLQSWRYIIKSQKAVSDGQDCVVSKR